MNRPHSIGVHPRPSRLVKSSGCRSLTGARVSCAVWQSALMGKATFSLMQGRESLMKTSKDTPEPSERAVEVEDKGATHGGMDASADAAMVEAPGAAQQRPTGSTPSQKKKKKKSKKGNCGARNGPSEAEAEAEGEMEAPAEAEAAQGQPVRQEGREGAAEAPTTPVTAAAAPLPAAAIKASLTVKPAASNAARSVVIGATVACVVAAAFLACSRLLRERR